MAQKLTFSRRKTEITHPNPPFKGNIVQHSNSQRCLGLLLNKKLKFDRYLNEKYLIVNRGMALLLNIIHYIRRHTSSLIISSYKSFIRPHFDYCDVIYDQPQSIKFKSFKIMLVLLLR